MSEERVPTVLGTPEKPITLTPHPTDPHRFTVQGLIGDTWTEHLQVGMDAGLIKKRLGE